MIEALVGLALIAVALLLTMALLAQEPAIIRRLAAHGEVMAVLDTLHESVRAGQALPRRGSVPYDWRALNPPPVVATAEGLQVWLEVEPAPRPDLDRLTLRARYTVGSRSYERVVETLVWRPR